MTHIQTEDAHAMLSCLLCKYIRADALGSAIPIVDLHYTGSQDGTHLFCEYEHRDEVLLPSRLLYSKDNLCPRFDEAVDDCRACSNFNGLGTTCSTAARFCVLPGRPCPEYSQSDRRKEIMGRLLFWVSDASEPESLRHFFLMDKDAQELVKSIHPVFSNLIWHSLGLPAPVIWESHPYETCPFIRRELGVYPLYPGAPRFLWKLLSEPRK